ncbi:MAG: DsbA family protein [Chloroflexi bacterium]|nr:DsbA family protein [Chloroflexota bacterium]
MNARWRAAVVFAFAVGLLAVAAACGGGDDDASTPTGGSSPGAGTTTAAPTSASSPSTDAVLAAIQQLAIPAGLAEGRTLGKSDAPVRLTMWEDFQCPFCLKYTAQIEPTIVDEFVKTGKVRIEFRQWPILGQESLNAAIASQCAAEQKKFWEYHRALFLIQAEAGQHLNEKLNAGRFSDPALLGIADRVGVDTRTWVACYQAKDYLATTQEDARAAQTAGLKGTPGFAINGAAIQTPASLDAWRKLLNDAVAKAKQ